MTGEFEPITESGPLVRELRQQIASEGPITFRDFMAAALYHPRYGYYTRTDDAPARGGDFVTSPEVHPIFGVLIAKTLRELWANMGCPQRFTVVEAGAGTGRLAHDVLQWAKQRDADFWSAIHYMLVDTSGAMRRRQERTLAALGIPDSKVSYGAALPASIEGVILSNELLDALPVHRVTRNGVDLQEIFVTTDGYSFVDLPLQPSTLQLAEYFTPIGLLPGEGTIAEVNLDAVRWVRDAADRLKRGYILTFDYGYDAADLYAPWRKDGTLLCFYRQGASSDPYQRVGKQDMTSSVDFTTLQAEGSAAGLVNLARTNQSSFLMRLGIGEGLTEAQHQMEEYFARRRVVMDLIDPARLGRINVLIQGKGVDDSVPLGFKED